MVWVNKKPASWYGQCFAERWPAGEAEPRSNRGSSTMEATDWLGTPVDDVTEEECSGVLNCYGGDGS